MATADDSFDVQDDDLDEDDAPAQDAVSLLSADHAEVKQMFENYRQLVDENADDEQRGELARHICAELGVHAEIEEEIFYPSMRESIDADLILDEAEVEHAAAKDLIEQIEREKPPSWSEWEALTRHAVERFHRPDEGIAICPAPSGPQRCTDEMLAGCAALADELDWFTHVTRMFARALILVCGLMLLEFPFTTAGA